MHLSLSSWIQANCRIEAPGEHIQDPYVLWVQEKKHFMWAPVLVLYLRFPVTVAPFLRRSSEMCAPSRRQSEWRCGVLCGAGIPCTPHGMKITDCTMMRYSLHPWSPWCHIVRIITPVPTLTYAVRLRKYPSPEVSRSPPGHGKMGGNGNLLEIQENVPTKKKNGGKWGRNGGGGGNG